MRISLTRVRALNNAFLPSPFLRRYVLPRRRSILRFSPLEVLSSDVGLHEWVFRVYVNAPRTDNNRETLRGFQLRPRRHAKEVQRLRAETRKNNILSARYLSLMNIYKPRPEATRSVTSLRVLIALAISSIFRGGATGPPAVRRLCRGRANALAVSAPDHLLAAIAYNFFILAIIQIDIVARPYPPSIYDMMQSFLIKKRTITLNSLYLYYNYNVSARRSHYAAI